MLEKVKTKIEDLLKGKEVSLAMLYNRNGEILWHCGRTIKGNTIEQGIGFSKSYIKKMLSGSDTITLNNVLICKSDGNISESAHCLKLKSIMIHPISEHMLLYIDSGTKESFTAPEQELFMSLGSLLSEMIKKIDHDEKSEGGISGESSFIQEIREKVLRYSIEEAPVLLLGETGVGKSHIAELIHKYSGRSGRFITINCPSIQESLFESVIFGHAKGAFTGADSNQKGFVDAAEGGTLFFDEITEIPVSFQAKLLRFIETKCYHVLGQTNEQKANVRIVTATNKSIGELIGKKLFREDLYYRLQILQITIPPLRERKQDIRTLIEEKKYLLKNKEMGADFFKVMLDYKWPGNVRELITVLFRAGIDAVSPITGHEIMKIIKQSSLNASPISSSQQDEIQGAWEKIQSGQNFWQVIKTPYLERNLKRQEVQMFVLDGLSKVKGKYKNLLNLFNLKSNEYKKLMNFLTVHNIMSKTKSDSNQPLEK
jgi:transcriptional regulator with PAS, ATPase and Fis domain